MPQLGAQQQPHQALDRLRIDGAVADAVLGQGVADGADRAGGAVQGADARQVDAAAPGEGDGLAGVADRRLPVAAAQAVGGEEALGQHRAADLPAEHAARPRAAAEDQLGAAAADVEDAAVRPAGGRGLHHPAVDVVALLGAAQHPDRVAERGLAAGVEVARALPPEGVGGDRREAARPLPAHHPGDLAQAVAGGRLVAAPDVAVLLHPGAERHVLLELVAHLDAAVGRHRRVQHVEAVGAQVEDAIRGLRHRSFRADPSAPPGRRSGGGRGRSPACGSCRRRPAPSSARCRGSTTRSSRA